MGKEVKGLDALSPGLLNQVFNNMSAYDRESILNMGLTLDPNERLAEKLPIEINLPGGGRTKVFKPREYTGQTKEGKVQTIYNTPSLFTKFLDTPIGKIGNTIRTKFLAALNKPTTTKKDVTGKEKYSTSLEREHGLSKASMDAKLPIPSYYKDAQYITTGGRNAMKRNYQTIIDNAIASKNSLVAKFKNKEISKGKFLEQKNAIDNQMNLVSRDLRKLGLVVVSVSPKGKIETFGKTTNLVQLINDIPKSYKLNIIPVSKKNKRTIDAITKPPGRKDGGIVGISHLTRPL
tara:strand:+ start:42 stop:914 length:873 start_codon:yes stop_codon:yes gene_type:complete